MLLTFWFWLADGAAFVGMPMGEGVAMRLALPPLTFDALFGVDAPDDAAPLPDDEDAEDSEDEADEEGSDDEPEGPDDDE